MGAMITGAVPQLPSMDLAAAKKFYEEKLGFTAIAHYPDLLVMTKDGAELQLWKCSDRNIAEHSGCYFYVNDVDEQYRVYRHLPCVTGRPQENAHGNREFSLLDDSGNLLVFGQQAMR